MTMMKKKCMSSEQKHLHIKIIEANMSFQKARNVTNLTDEIECI